MSSLTRLTLAATVLMVAACATNARLDDSVPPGETGRESSARRRTVRASPTPDLAAPDGTSASAPARAAVRVADQLQQYLDRVLGPSASSGTWRGHIRRVTVGLHTATIQTDLSSTDRDRAVAAQICRVASWFKHSPEGRHVTSLDIEVHGRGGAMLAAHDDTSIGLSARRRARTQVPNPPASNSRPLQPGLHPTPTPAAGPPRDDGRRES